MDSLERTYYHDSHTFLDVRGTGIGDWEIEELEKEKPIRNFKVITDWGEVEVK